jgi:ABC-2 type transport system permease protein
MKTLHLVRKELLELLRQWEMLAVILIVPVLQIAFLSSVGNTDIRHIPLAIVDLSRLPASLDLANRILSSPLFEVRLRQNAPLDPASLLKSGRVRGVILLRDPRPIDLHPGAFPSIEVHLDGIDANTAAITAENVQGIVDEWTMGRASFYEARGMPEHRPMVRFNPHAKDVMKLGPGFVIILQTLLLLSITSTAIVREKEQRSMDNLLTRLEPWQIFAGKALAAALVGLAVMILDVATVQLLFPIPFRGSLLLLLLVGALYMTTIITFALAISIYSNTQQNAMLFSWFFLLLFTLLSGILTPVENVPDWLAVLTWINPMRYVVAIVRDLLLKGNGITHFWRELTILLVQSALIATWSLRQFKRWVGK